MAVPFKGRGEDQTQLEDTPRSKVGAGAGSVLVWTCMFALMGSDTDGDSNGSDTLPLPNMVTRYFTCVCNPHNNVN